MPDELKDKWPAVERLREALQNMRITGQLVVDFKNGVCMGGKQVTSF